MLDDRTRYRKRRYEFGDGVTMQLGRRTLVMGILNATPDSFSDGGRYLGTDAAVAHAVAMVEQGADILDIGGESTRPGAEQIDQMEEERRVIPVIAAIRRELPHVPLSIDTYKAETAKAALEAGAHIINDIWGLKGDPHMASVAAEYGCPVVISHNRHSHQYENLVHDVISDLRSSIGLARAAGVKDEWIWLDPGIGFAKSYEENLELMGRLSDIADMGYPLLLGTSRKKFIQRTLNASPQEVVEGTAATVAVGIMHGCQIVRVHDVAAIKRTVRMVDAIQYR
ncbi:dihydropteroate synthase [Paenibacillus chungangensis]|uniref:Dihydropteroate synthase n=1 Tax=Paenibacillus chungangensis TaxID=696535 RepID=A0ABW3HWY3_9BACL